jgi:subfamily B ATP-binding cassette protein MsbA
MKSGRREIINTLRYAAFPGLLAVGFMTTACYTGAQMYLPVALKRIIDEVLTGNHAELLVSRITDLALTATVMAIFQGAQRISSTVLGERSLINLRRDMLIHLQKLPVSFFDNERSGRLHSLFTNDSVALIKIIHPILGEVMLSLLQIIGIVVLVAIQYGSTVFLSALLIPIYICFPVFLSRPTRQASHRVQEANAEAAAGLLEGIGAIREIKAFTRETWNVSRMEILFRKVLTHQVRLSFINWIYSLSGAAYWLAVSFIYWFGGREVLGGRITIGQLVALVWYLSFLDVPITRLVAVNGQIQTALGAGRRIYDFLGSPAENPREGSKILSRSQHSVEFRNVSFTYAERERDALQENSFRAEPGQCVAIVGPSGAGKSSLMSLLLGFYDPQRGSILISDQDIAGYTQTSIRQQVSIVFQEPFLFASSVRENIRFGFLEATDSQIEAAARIAHAHEFITSLPEGYDTEIGERGAKLSVGQKQRIAIARAVVRNPSILILDEATSALDAESEYLVREAVKGLTAGRACFIVAHRLSTVVDSDLILVLDEGRIVARGAHQDLIQTSPVYRRFYELQFGTESSSSSLLKKT